MDSNVDTKERERVFRICSKNLDGEWRSCCQADLTICRLSGGMTNLLYSCVLPDNSKELQVNNVSHEEPPRRVLVRIYGSAEIDLPVQLEVFNQLASENLGPKLYATFEGGRIEELLLADALSLKQLQDPDISACIAKKLAAAHCLQVKSLCKEPNWLIDKLCEFQRLIETFQPKAGLNGHIPLAEGAKKNTPDSTLAIAEQMLSLDLKAEIDYVSQLIHQSETPLVFSHNDLHQNNILLSRDNHLQHLEDRVVLIDFEYCSYNYQPHDLANHLSEWCFDYSLDKYPFFTASTDRFPNTVEQKRFLSHYVDELKSKFTISNSTNGSSTGKSLITDVDLLYEKMQPFLMISNLFWSIWAMSKAYTSDINFGYWEMAKAKHDIYSMCKENFQKVSELDDKNKNSHDQGDTQVQSKM